MTFRLHPVVIIGGILCVIGIANIYIMRSSILSSTSGEKVSKEITIMGTQSSGIFKFQRNQVSRILNDVKQELAIMSCEMIDLKSKLQMSTSIVSASGGWCKRSSYNNSGSHICDKALARSLSTFFKGQRVASFGDGPGDYKRFMDSSGLLEVYDAYDGAPYGPETSGGAVKFLDLTAPQYGLPLYDWVISLEVAEHIPAKYESIYVDNIVRHASKGIVLSWARLGQGGLSHVNNKPLEYVQKILSDKGFEPNMKESQMLQMSASFGWLRNNVYVYRRRNDSFAQDELA